MSDDTTIEIIKTKLVQVGIDVGKHDTLTVYNPEENTLISQVVSIQPQAYLLELNILNPAFKDCATLLERSELQVHFFWVNVVWPCSGD
jgi:hypothetical protein